MNRAVVPILALSMLSLAGCAIMSTPSKPAEWSPIACPLAERSASERFDVVQAVDDFDKGIAGWQPRVGGQNATSTLHHDTAVKHAGTAALRIDYTFVGKEQYEYVDFGRPIVIDKPGLGLGFWVKCDAAKLALRLRINDKSGETHQVDLARLGIEGWHYVACAFEGPGSWWGGDGNRRLDYPCTVVSIVADRPARGYKGKGSLWIDGVQLVRPRKVTEALAVEVLGKRLGNVYEPGDSVRLRASGPGEGIRWRVTDYWQRELAMGEGGDIGFAMPTAGFYACTIERLEGGQVAERRVFRCAALPPANRKRSNTFVGLCSHYGHRAYPLESLDLLARLGITEIRDEISWGNCEREKGKLALPEFAQTYIAHAHALGIRPLIIFDYANRFYDDGGYPLSDEAVAGYVRYAEFLARELRGRVPAFEVWNEYSGGCGMRGKTGKQTPQTYARMLDATYRAVKKAVPEATIVGIGGEHSKHHFPNIEGMLKAGAAKTMDALSVHPYRYPSTPEDTDLIGELQAVADLARRHGAPVRLWITEVGWPTHTGPRGVDERTQASIIVRAMALMQSTGFVDKVHWYDYKNDGFTREYNEHNFGVVWHQKFNLAPKPAAITLSVFARLTAGATPKRLWHEGNAYAVFYTLPRGGELAVAWATKSRTTATVGGRRLKALDIQGNALAVAKQVTLSANPIYLTGRGLSLALADK